MLRTHNCGSLRLEDIGKDVILCGWIHTIRDKGNLIWIDLRDRYGITQLFVETKEYEDKYVDHIRSLGREYVVRIFGKVFERYSKNDEISTGKIEVYPKEVEILNKSRVPPFTITEPTDGGEDIRMKYRYLDLRRSSLQESLYLRYCVSKYTRHFLDSREFWEIETPMLVKSTPEGARDFIVPSRLNKGTFYALPQSPQLFKQLLMIGSYDRYFQITRCFRDEDLRSDRQPEFTQIDCEMSFVEREDVLQTFESLMQDIFHKILDIQLPSFTRITYEESVNKYGTDRPHIGIGMPIIDITSLTRRSEFKVFESAELVVAINVKNGCQYTRKQLDSLNKWVKDISMGYSNLVYVKCFSSLEEDEFKSSISKFYSNSALKEWANKCSSSTGDMMLIVAGNKLSTRELMGKIRLEIATRDNIFDIKKFYPLWVTDFPLFQKVDSKWSSVHHPFTSPIVKNLDIFDTDINLIKSDSYDIVINGVEIGGGSIRIHNRELQEKVFEVIGISKKEREEKFGFFLESLEYGCPPHGGIALGLDRICSLLLGDKSIRSSIAFPKNTMGADTMLNTPSYVSKEQLLDLGLANN